MIELKDENGFKVCIESVKSDYFDDYYVSKVYFYQENINLIAKLTNNKHSFIFVVCDPLSYMISHIYRAVYDNVVVCYDDHVEPDLEVYIIPENFASSFNESKYFQIMFGVDSAYFIGFDDGYIGANIFISLDVTKESLLKFADDLEKEYQ